MNLLAIDPGTTESAYVLFFDGRICDAEKVATDRMLEIIGLLEPGTMVAIERLQSFGMPVGVEEKL
jgi:hypothetical protein